MTDTLGYIKRYLAGLYFDLFLKVYRKEGMEFHIPKEQTSREFRSRFALDTYETEEEYLFVDKYLPRDAVLLELGGCIGVMSCFSNRRLDRPEKHLVIEPNPNLLPWLEKNRDRNRCEFAIDHRVISKSETVEFYINSRIVEGSMVNDLGTPITVEATTFQELEREYGMKFDSVIMDIEGGELQLLRDHREYFRQLDNVFIEIHPFPEVLTDEEARECVEILSEIGFRKRDASSDGWYQVWTK